MTSHSPDHCNRKSLHLYLRKNRTLWHILPPRLKLYVETYADQPYGGKFPSNHLRDIGKVAREIYKEKKRLAYLVKKQDWIEGTNIHNIRPDLYVFCKSVKIHTIHGLRAFANAARDANPHLHVLLPKAKDLVEFCDEYMR